MKLKPCPFCGGEAEVVPHLYYSVKTQSEEVNSFHVGCKKCQSQGYAFWGTEEQAIKAWNRREPMDWIVKQLEAELYRGMESLDTVLISFNFGINKAIEIVKKGGVSDEESKG